MRGYRDWFQGIKELEMVTMTHKVKVAKPIACSPYPPPVSS